MTSLQSAASASPSWPRDPAVRKSRLGFQGHMHIAPETLQIVESYGIRIHKEDRGLFSLSHIEGEKALYDLLPSFIDLQPYTGSVNGYNKAVVDRGNLVRFARFLHHPVALSLEDVIIRDYDADEALRTRWIAETHPHDRTAMLLYGTRVPVLTDRAEARLDRRATTLKKHQERREIHSLLRFMSEGSVQIPVYVNEELMEQGSCECHAVTQMKWEEANLWSSAPEIGIRHAAGKTVQDRASSATLPGLSYSPDTGFNISLDPRFLSSDGFEDPAHMELVSFIFTAIEKATGRPAAFIGDRLFLTAAEFEAFCQEAHESLKSGDRAGLADLLTQVEIAERRQEALKNIEIRAQALLACKVFERLASAQPVSERDITQRIQLLGVASTALTSILDSDMMRRGWAYYRHSARNEPLMDTVIKEYRALQDVLSAFSQESIHEFPGQLKLEAAAHEFYPLLAFSRHMLETLKAGAKDSPDADRVVSAIDEIDQVIQNSALIDVFLEEDHLSDHHKTVLEVLRKMTGQAGSPLAQTARSGAATTVEFLKEIGESLTDSPKVGIAATALAAFMWYATNGANGAALPALTEDAATAQQLFQTVFDPLTLEEIRIPIPLAEGAAIVQQAPEVSLNYHWHLGPLGPYKHFVFNNIVLDPSIWQMELIRRGFQMPYDAMNLMPQDFAYTSTPAFSVAAENTIRPVADFWFLSNILQNASHAALWTFAGVTGYAYGLKGLSRSLEFFDETTDSLRVLRRSRPLVLPAALAGLGVGSGVAYLRHLGFELRDIMPPDTVLADWSRIEDAFNSRDPEKKFTFSNWYCSAAPGALAGATLAYPLWHRRFASQSDIYKGLLQQGRAHILADFMQAGHQRQLALSAPALQGRGPARTAAFKINLGRGGYLKEDFTLNARTLPLIRQALDGFDLCIRHIADQIGAEERWQQIYLRRRLQNVTGALRDYNLGRIDETALKTAMDRNLRHLIGAQLRQHGRSSLYNAFFDQDMPARQESALRSAAAAAEGRALRAERLGRHWDAMTGRAAADVPFTLTGLRKHEDLCTGKAKAGEGALKSSAVMLGTGAAQGISSIFRAAQTGLRILPPKARLAMMAGTALGAYSAVSLDMSGRAEDFAGPQGAKVVETVSAATGTAAAAAVTSGNFLFFNTVEDIALVHVGMVVLLIVGGAAVGGVHRKLNRPLVLAIEEGSPHAKAVLTALSGAKGAALGAVGGYFAQKFGFDVEISHAVAATAALGAGGHLAKHQIEALYDKAVAAWDAVSQKTGGAVQVACRGAEDTLHEYAALKMKDAYNTPFPDRYTPY